MNALGSLLSRLAHVIRLRTAEALADVDLDPRTAGVLLALREDGPSNLTSLGRATRIDRTTIGERVDALTERGLLERTRSDADRRVVLVSLTDAGQTLADDVAERVSHIEDSVLHVLDRRERDHLRDLLTRAVADIPERGSNDDR